MRNMAELELPLDAPIPLTTTPPRQSFWRPIHYLGSKLRIAGSLLDLVEHVDPSGGPVCDLFAGSATMTAAFATRRDVIAVDIQEYSRVLCSAVLKPRRIDDSQLRSAIRNAHESEHLALLQWALEPLITHEAECIKQANHGNPLLLCELLSIGPIIGHQRGFSDQFAASLRSALQLSIARLKKADLLEDARSVVTRYYGGLYFSFRQSVQFDALLDLAHEATGPTRDVLLAAIISTASEVVNTVGKQFAQPIKLTDSKGEPKRHLLPQIRRDRELDVLESFAAWVERYRSIPATGRPHQVIKDDYTSAFEKFSFKPSVVYADPPYTRDHYSRFYHVLETMCLRDTPEISTRMVKGSRVMSRGSYRLERHQSPFCIISQAPQAFDRLFSAVRDLGSPLVLSYSPYAAGTKARPRVMTIERLQKIASQKFGRVEIVPVGRVSHSKLNSSRHNKEVTYNGELALLCR